MEAKGIYYYKFGYWNYEGGIENILFHNIKYSQIEFENIIVKASAKAFIDNINKFQCKKNEVVKYVYFSSLQKYILQVLINDFGFNVITFNSKVLPYELSYIQTSASKLENIEGVELDDNDNEPIILKIAQEIINSLKWK